jgi:hypothetical protein
MCSSDNTSLGLCFGALYSSCSPNAVLHFDGKHAVVRALENINKGTEVNSITLEHSVGLNLLHAMESSRRSI